jgi:exopolysaccharide production protein ExoY
MDLEATNVTEAKGAEETRKRRLACGSPIWKRVLDIAIIIFLLPGALVVGLIVALVVKCGSRGPVFFRQERVGYRGSRFMCYKFRTMLVNADTSAHQGHTTQLIRQGGAMTKLDSDHDPRVIPFGVCLRATGLDELPQLINVLRGEMSIVGPRPCIPYEYDLYGPWQRHRFDAVPGLTGLWQVSGKNRTTFNQMIDLDINYSRRMSLWLDLKILIKTLPALWTQCSDVIQKKKTGARSRRTVHNAPPVNVRQPVHSNS